MNTQTMNFPSSTVAPSIYTEFVNGVKFDICEVVKEAYDMLDTPKARYFLCVEDAHIVSYEAAEKWFAVSGESRWGFFCMTKAECKAMIRDYESRCEQVERWNEIILQKSGIKPMILPKISDTNDYCLRRYGAMCAAMQNG